MPQAPVYDPEKKDDEKTHGDIGSLDGSHDRLNTTDEVRNKELSDLEGSLDTPFEGKNTEKSASPGELKSSEENAGNGSDNDQIPYTDEDSGTSGQRIRSVFTKKRVAIGGGVGVLIGGFFAISTIISGPLQLIHLSQVLGKGMLPNSLTADNRLHKIYKHMRGSRNISEARLNFTSRAVYRNTLDKLAAKGFTVDSSARGYANMEVDVSKAYPDIANLQGTNKRLALARELGIDPTKVSYKPGTIGTNTNTLVVDSNNLTGKEYRNLASKAAGAIGDGKLATGVRKNIFARAHNIPNLFHPFRYLERAVDSPTDRLFADYKKKAEETRKKKQSSKTTQASKARDSLKKAANSKFGKAVGAVSLGLDVACTLYNIAEMVPIANYGLIVAPSMVEAFDKTASGNQAMAGQDVSLLQLGATTASLTDESGKSIWGAKSLNALANNSAGEGEDLSNNYRQAFSPRTTEEMIQEYVGGLIGKVLGKSVSVACSPVGQAINIVGGLALTAFTGGGWTAGKVASATTKAILISSLIGRLSSEAVDYLAEDPAKAFSGPVGGNLMAYGIRAANNSMGRMGGGVELSQEDEVAIWKEVNNLETEEFKQKGLLARVFDVTDYRSLASTTLRSSTEDYGEISSGLANTITNPLKILATSVSNNIPKTYANSQYDYGFPLYGIPSEVLNDVRFDDPYDNAERAAKIFNSGRYVEKAKKCFGVTITKTTEGWDSIPQDDPNPAESSYSKASCDDLSDDDWKRVMLFVYDSQLMSTIACYEGVDESECTKLGYGSISSAATPATETPGIVTSEDLAKDSMNVPCAPGTRDLGSPAGFEGYYGGQVVPIKLCAIPGFKTIHGEYVPGDNGDVVVNSRVSQNYLNLFTAAQSQGITYTAFGAFRTMDHQTRICEGNSLCTGGDYSAVARPGYSFHQIGAAVDFDLGDGLGADTNSYSTASGGPPNQSDPRVGTTDKWGWLNENAKGHGLVQYWNEPWHWSPVNAATSGAGF